jgi:hypothetical protein
MERVFSLKNEKSDYEEKRQAAQESSLLYTCEIFDDDVVLPKSMVNKSLI